MSNVVPMHPSKKRDRHGRLRLSWVALRITLLTLIATFVALSVALVLVLR